VGESELLMSVAPIRLMSVGGFVSVKLLQNRNSTIDVDCLIDPNVEAAPEYTSAFWGAVRRVASSYNLEKDWLNDELRNFIKRSKRQDLFLESVEQGIVLYEGMNITIFAGSLEWALERKIRRIANAERPRPKDVEDAVAVTNFIISYNGHPLSAEYLRRLNRNEFDEGPMGRGIRTIAQRYVQVYGEAGIV
jgi:hypothetical protein